MEYNFSRSMSNLKPSAIREIFKSLTDPSIISFSAGNPSVESFPVKEIGEISKEIFDSPTLSAQALQYSITEGYSPLITQVKNRLKNKFNIGNDFDDLIITSGGQQGIDLTCKILCNENDTIICEKPSFIGSLNAFRSYGVNLYGVELRDDGMDIEMLENALKTKNNVKLIYTISTFQNPTGITTSLEKRKQIYSLAKKYNVLILEDNPYGELRFSGEDIPTLKSLDTEGIVIYSGSFSKILSAGMRVGFLCAPKPIISKVVVAKQTNDVHTNIFFQMICSEFIKRYNLDDHIANIRKLYGRKCKIMLDSLESTVDNRIKFTRPEGGIFFWCSLPEGYDSAEFAKVCINNKVAIVPGTAFLTEIGQSEPGFRLNYSMPTDDEIVKGIT